jgi:hypothetical protein
MNGFLSLATGEVLPLSEDEALWTQTGKQRLIAFP